MNCRRCLAVSLVVIVWLGVHASLASAQTRSLFISSSSVARNEAVKNDILRTDARFDHVNSTARSFGRGSILPTLSDLLTFDSVLLWTDPLTDILPVSDLFADYVDQGGHLVIATFYGQSWNAPYDVPTGRLETGGYVPLTNPVADASIIYSPGSLGTFDATDPLLAGVVSLSATQLRADYGAGLAPGAVLVASWDDGAPLVARNASGNVINITLFPDHVGSGHITGDYDQLFRNALAFEQTPPITPVPEPGTYALIATASLAAVVVIRRFRSRNTRSC